MAMEPPPVEAFLERRVRPLMDRQRKTCYANMRFGMTADLESNSDAYSRFDTGKRTVNFCMYAGSCDGCIHIPFMVDLNQRIQAGLQLLTFIIRHTTQIGRSHYRPCYASIMYPNYRPVKY